MAGYYPSTCNEIIPPHNCDPCDTREYGRIRSFGFIKSSYNFSNPSSAAEWRTAMNAENIIVVPFSNGELQAASEVLGQGYGSATETLIGFDFVAVVNDPNYSENCDFYNAIATSRNYKFFYVTSSHVHITDVACTFIPKAPIANDLNSEVVWNVTVKWRDQNHACPYDLPATIFDDCFINN